MVDAGEGCQQQMFRYGINPLKLKAIFISHLHGDHVFGLMPLLSTLSLYGRKTEITIYAPRPFGEMLEFHKQLFANNISYPVNWVEVKCRKMERIFENRTLEVWSVPLQHRIATSGYIFREREPALNVEKFKIEKYGLSIAQITAAKRGEDITLKSGEVVANSEITYLPHRARSYAYLSDTAYFKREAEYCQGVDMIYHEATYGNAESVVAKQRGHSTAAEAAQVAKDAGAKSLIIGHFSTRYRDLTPLLHEARELFPATELAEEGCKFEIKKER